MRHDGIHKHRCTSKSRYRHKHDLLQTCNRVRMSSCYKGHTPGMCLEQACCMTELDISKFDAISIRTCKRISRLPRPVSISSTMVHQDTDQAGLGLPSLTVTHAEVSCRYLVQALKDRGSLGHVTQYLLLLQDKAIGVALTQPHKKKSSNFTD